MLKGIRIVVSTHQVGGSFAPSSEIPTLRFKVLLDALVHGFIRMDGLALMVFDEGR